MSHRTSFSAGSGARCPGSEVRGPRSGEEYVMHRGTRPGQGLCIAYSHTAWIPPQGFVLAPFVALATTIRQTADPLPQNDRFSAFFAEWVCTLATTSPQVAASPPPNKGHCIIRDRTRRRNADSLLKCGETPTTAGAEGTVRPEGTAAVPVGGGGAWLQHPGVMVDTHIQNLARNFPWSVFN